MTIEELKAMTIPHGWKVITREGREIRLDDTLCRLAPEILALVEAVERHKETECYMDGGVLFDALDAFNTKLASL